MRLWSSWKECGMLGVGISSVEGSVCSVLLFFLLSLFSKESADTKASGYPESTVASRSRLNTGNSLNIILRYHLR